jgi:hypothetical protein
VALGSDNLQMYGVGHMRGVYPFRQRDRGGL